ncbi:MAG: hypothetical protein R3F56_01345 [Planctomycetota bacterium]
MRLRHISILSLCAAAAAQAPRLLLDIDRTPVGPPSSNPYAFTFLGSEAYFSADTHPLGVEPYRTDFTAVGTAVLRDLAPGPDSSFPSAYGRLGNDVLFLAEDSRLNGHKQVWRSDRSAVGTVLVADIGSLGAPAVVATATELRGAVVFASHDGSTRLLVRSDGTPAGTSVLGQFPNVSPRLYTAKVSSTFGSLWFLSGSSLVRTDGTAAGTSVVVADTIPLEIASLGQDVFCSAVDGLWRVGAGSAALVYPDRSLRTGVANVNGRLLFASGNDLLVSDGTGAGTTVLRTFTSVGGVVAAGAVGYFVADDGVAGRELWQTDATAAGTRLVADLTPGAAGSNILGITALGSRVLFRFQTAAFGDELWVSDGTASGTLGFDLEPGPAGSQPGNIVADPSGQRALFSARRVATGFEPWVTDGTAAGTHMVADLATSAPRTEGSEPVGFARIGTQTLFFANDPSTGVEPWTSDGTTAGTRLLLDINAGPASSITFRSPPLSTGNRVFFWASTNTFGNELWVTDGTAVGTRMVADLTPGSSDTSPGPFARLDERRVLFTGSTGGPRGLFVSDGSAAGTLRLADVSGGVIAVANGKAVFAGRDALGAEPWITDGTVAGTHLIADVVPGAQGSDPQPVVYGDAVYFAVSAGVAPGLWRTDGSTLGTHLVVPLTPAATALTSARNRLYFTGLDPQTGREPWVSDGTVAGTYLLADVEPGPLGSSPAGFVAVDNGVLFLASSSLWRTDGSRAGTQSVFDPGPATSGSGFVAGSRRFWASSASSAWGSDGTVAGTRVLSGLSAGRQPQFGLAGNALLGGIDDGVHGSELWLIEVAARAVRVGAGCGSGWRELRLSASDPVLGTSVHFDGAGLSPGSPAAIVLGSPLRQPLAFPGTTCTLYLDAAAPYLVLPTVALGVDYVANLGLPGVPSLNGAQLMAQAIGLSPAFGLGFETSNGVALSLGSN